MLFLFYIQTELINKLSKFSNPMHIPTHHTHQPPHNLSQNLKYLLNRSMDEQTYQSQKHVQIEYMKRFYNKQQSLSKLNKLIQHYTSSNNCNRFLIPKVHQFYFKHRLISETDFNPQNSQYSVISHFNFCTVNVLSQSVVCGMEGDIGDRSIYQLFRSLGGIEDRNQFGCQIRNQGSIPLNYVPFRSRNKINKPMQRKIQKQLETVQEKWIKNCKFLKRQNTSVLLKKLK